MSVPFVDLAAMHAGIAVELEEAWRRITISTKFVGGAFVERFEAEWADFCGTRHCVGVSDGTAALELSLRALDIGPGDQVIVPANTFIATWEAIVAVGARPVGIDVDPRTLLMTAEGVEAACTPRTAAVIVVHLFGQPVDMDAINRVAQRAGIAVIEDAAQAHGATWLGRRAGGLSEIGCFSFYPSKNLGAFGDAGAVVTNRANIADRIRSLCNHGRHRNAADRHVVVGSNRRLDSLQAAILSVKLAHLEKWNAARRRIARRYDEHLADLPIETVEVAHGAMSSHHLAILRVSNRNAVRRALAADGIGTGVHYPIPCHRQKGFAHIPTSPLPVVERAARRLLSLPMYPQLTDIQVDWVCASMRRVLGRPKPASRSATRPPLSRRQLGLGGPPPLHALADGAKL
jgi:dTDP-4-amino-4,6-dideoxygalactose transaminase